MCCVFPFSYFPASPPCKLHLSQILKHTATSCSMGWNKRIFTQWMSKLSACQMNSYLWSAVFCTAGKEAVLWIASSFVDWYTSRMMAMRPLFFFFYNQTLSVEPFPVLHLAPYNPFLRWLNYQHSGRYGIWERKWGDRLDQSYSETT